MTDDLFQRLGIEPPPAPERAEGDLFERLGIPAPEPKSVQQQNQEALARPGIETAPPEVQQKVKEDQANWDYLASARFDEQQIRDMKAKGPIGFFEAWDFLEWEDVTPGGGIAKGGELLFTLMPAIEKLKNGEKLSPSEAEAMNNYIDRQIEMGVRGFSYGGKVMYHGAPMPAFMVEFALSGGLGKLAQKGGEKLVGKYIKNQVMKKGVGLAANFAARGVALPGMYVRTYGERRVHDAMAITDRGQIILNESKETPVKAAFKALGYTYIEAASELAGGKIGQYAINPLIKKPLKIGASKLAPALKWRIFREVKKLRPNATVEKVFSAGGWNGALEEIGEERLADILRATFDLATEEDIGLEDALKLMVPDPEQVMVEAGIFSIIGGAKMSATGAAQLLEHKLGPEKAKETVENMTVEEQEKLIHDTVKLKKAEPVDTKQQEALSPVAASQEKVASEQGDVELDHSESGWQKFYREMVNALQPLEDAANTAKERIGKLIPGADPFFMSRTYAGLTGVIRHSLYRGAVRFNDRTGQWDVTGPGFGQILDSFNTYYSDFESNTAAREQDFEDYLIARRTLEDLAPREDVEVSEKDLAKSAADIARLQAKYGEEFQGFDEFAQQVYEYQRNTLQNLVDAGVLSQEQYDVITKQNPNYIPFQRVFEEEGFVESINANGVFTDAASRKVIKKIVGSDRDVKSTTESVMKNTAKILDLAYRNKVALSVARLADVIPEHVQKVKTPMKKVTVEDPDKKGRMIETYRPSGQKPAGTIIVYENGKKQYYAVAKPLLEAMQSLTPHEISMVERVVGGLFRMSAATLRVGATMIPEFWARNVIRDQTVAFMQSKVNPTPIDMVRGLAAAIGRDDLYWEWMRNGGSFNSYMELSDKGLERAHRELTGKHGKLRKYMYGLNFVRILEDISMTLETGTRIGVYNKVKKQGGGGIIAALEAREATLDFARGGRSAKAINRYVPFFNVGVQGVDKMVRTFKDDPVGTIVKGTATITIPSIAITGYYLYAAPDDERQEFLEIPQWQRDLFWCFKVGDEWRRIPKPFSYGYLFGSMPERFMLWGYKGDKPEMKEFWKELVLGVGGTFSPIYDATSLIPPVIKGYIEGLTNYNFFLDRPIYPKWQDSRLPQYRRNKYTSETTKKISEWLGEVGIETSPAVVENWLRAQFAGSTDYALDAGDKILEEVRKWNGEEIPEGPITPSDKALIRAFSVRNPTGFRSNSAQNFFLNWEEVQQTYNTYRALRREGEEAEAEALHEKGQNKFLIRAYKPMRKFYEGMRDLGKQADKVRNDPRLSSEEKVKRMAELGDRIRDIAIRANKWYKQNVNKVGK